MNTKPRLDLLFSIVLHSWMCVCECVSVLESIRERVRTNLRERMVVFRLISAPTPSGEHGVSIKPTTYTNIPHKEPEVTNNTRACRSYQQLLPKEVTYRLRWWRVCWCRWPVHRSVFALMSLSEP